MKTTTPDFIRYYLAPLLHALDSYITRVNCDGETVRVVWVNGETRTVNIGGLGKQTIAINLLRIL